MSRNSFFEELPVKLTHGEWETQSKLLATKLSEKAKFDEESKAAKAKLNQEEKDRKTEIFKLGREVETGVGDRQVECYEVPDKMKHIFEVIRQDTGEVIRTRPMSQEERATADQTSLFGDDDDKHGSN